MRIRIVDLESTGEAPPDHGICEIGWCDVVAMDRNLVGDPCNWMVAGGGSMLTNPGCRIPPETSAIHHLIDDDVRNSPHFSDALIKVVNNDFRENSEEPIIALAAHSAEFEMVWITDEMTGGLPWLCTYKCALRLWPECPSHSNSCIRYWRRPEGLDREKALPAHRAGPDAYVSAFHVREMLDLASLDDLIKWSSEPALLPMCKIGKFRNGGAGTPWEEVDTGFLEWVLSKDFDENTVFTVRHHLDLREAQAREEREAYEQRRREYLATMAFRPPPIDEWFAGKPTPVREEMPF